MKRPPLLTRVVSAALVPLGEMMEETALDAPAAPVEMLLANADIWDEADAATDEEKELCKELREDVTEDNEDDAAEAAEESDEASTEL